MKKTVPVLIWLLFALPCQSRIITVDDDGPDDFNNIQAAINDANNGDIIEVQPGIYTGVGNRDIDFLGKAITVRSIEPDDPNIVAATIIDCNGSAAQPHRGFFCHNDEDSNSVLAGFTITNGYAERGGGICCEESRPTIKNCIITGNTAKHDGGGLCSCLPIFLPPPPGGPIPECNFPGPTITNCTISDNSADFGGGVYTEGNNTNLDNCSFVGNSAVLGGGILNNWGSQTLTDCTFSGNSAKWGGGIFNNGSNTTLTNCIFKGNSADFGGGIFNNGSNTTLTNCIFKGNSSDLGGGIFNSESSSILINCTFSRNYGGGMDNSCSNLMITNCTFIGNTASWGGGISNSDSNLIIINCQFKGNSAEWGGGISNYKANPTITNCVFRENSATEGAGMYNYDSIPNVSNCIFSGNSSFGAGWYTGCGGGMFNMYSSAQLMNCTFTGNRAGAKGGAIFWAYPAPYPNLFHEDIINSSIIASSIMISNLEYTGDTKPMITNCIFWNNKDWGNTEELSQIYFNPSYTTIIINYNCVQGWTGTLGGTGNIGSDPCFVGNGYWDPNTIPNQDEPYWLRSLWVDGDYHLLPDSPCMDAGDPNYVAEPNETDLDGKPRVINGRIDMGAYEYRPPIQADMRLIPRSISLKSKGKWIAAFIRLPEEYDVADIDPNSVLLENEIKPDSFRLIKDEQIALVKFDREQVQSILDIGEVELTITGRLIDGSPFEAVDIITVIDKGGEKPVKQHRTAR